MQDDKTTVSDATAEHRNPPRDLSGLAANLSAETTGSQRRLLRLSEKMSLARHRQRNSNTLSPTTPSSSRSSNTPRKDDKTTTSKPNLQMPNIGGQNQSEADSALFSEMSGTSNSVVGTSSMTSPTADDNSRNSGNSDMDRIEYKRAERNQEGREFFPQSPRLSGAPKSGTNQTALVAKTSPASSTASQRQTELQNAIQQARSELKTSFNIASSDSFGNANESVDLVSYQAKLVEESPNLFDQNEIFFKTADDAMQALLTANGFLTVSDAQSAYSSFGTALSTDGVSTSASVASAFVISDENTSSNFESLSRKDYSDELLSAKAKQQIEAILDEMQYPNSKLGHLLQTIASPPEGDVPDLSTTVRRKNACGALQVLALEPRNRIPLVWTTGVLAALTSVLSDTGTEGTIVTYPDKRHRVEFETGRDRAISCLVSLVTPKENRLPILHTPGLVHWLIVMILEGRGLSRRGACTILAFLAKTPDNRLLMVQVPRLVEALSKVLKRRPARMEQRARPSPVPEFSEEEEEDQAAGGNSHVSRENESEEFPLSQSEKHSYHQRPSESTRIASTASVYSNQSAVTQRFHGGRPSVELRSYDETADELLRDARKYAFAAFSSLLKEKDNAFHFARDAALVKVMSEIAVCHDSPSHEHAVKFLACLTRHRLNSKVLVFRRRGVVPALIKATVSSSDTVRLHACYALQNLSQDKSCRQELAISENLLICLCDRARGATEHVNERLAALSALKNLTDEPANLIPMSNTTDCIATLMHLAHGRQEGVTPLMQYRACDALATLSHWLRKIATSGQALNNAKNGKISNNKELFIPALRVVTVNQWQ
jgi:hypothetical protein